MLITQSSDWGTGAESTSHILIENLSPGEGAPLTWFQVPRGSLSTAVTFLTSAPTR